MNWKQVWESRPLPDLTLAGLMAADGYDNGFGRVAEESWRRYVKETSRVLGITPQSSVFEIGCGAGAYLYQLYQSGCESGGLDASSTLVGYARQAMPNGNWIVGEASEVNPAPQYDFVISSAVFLYFPSLEYAADVLERMVRKARHGVMVLDVPDLSTQDQCMNMRVQWEGKEAYALKYKGLDHLYFDRAWFRSRLSALGISRVEIEDQWLEGYANAPYRFNVFCS